MKIELRARTARLPAMVVAVVWSACAPTFALAPTRPPVVYDSQGREVQDPIVIEAVKRHGEHIQNLIHKANDLVRARRWNEALATYNEVAKTNPNMVLFDEVSDILVVLGRSQEAIDAFRQFVYRAGNGPDGKPARDWVDEHGQNLSEVVAKTYKEQWSGGGSDDAGKLARYAILLSQTGRYAEALQAYQWSTNRLMWSGSMERFMAWHPVLDLNKVTPISFDKRRFEAACYLILSRSPGAPLWATETGDVVERADIAVVAARKSIALRRDFAPAYLALGDALESQNKHGEARAAWKQALANAHDDVQRKAAKERLD